MYREVTMIEVRERRIAARLGLDPKTVRRYLTAAVTAGVRVTPMVSDEGLPAGPARVASRRCTTTGRWLGALSLRAGRDRALGR
jgi:hypothetical protein